MGERFDVKMVEVVECRLSGIYQYKGEQLINKRLGRKGKDKYIRGSFS